MAKEGKEDKNFRLGTELARQYRLEQRKKPMFSCEYCWAHFGSDKKPLVRYHSSQSCPNSPYNQR